jgi:hypothetical protein
MDRPVDEQTHLLKRDNSIDESLGKKMTDTQASSGTATPPNTTTSNDEQEQPILCWDLTRYQWLVLFASWMGWGLDIFDGLLFNFVAPNCIPTLLGLPIGSPEAKSATLNWTGIMSSVLLVCWGIGGIAFGKLCDMIGRKRTMQITIFMFAAATALCALSLNIWMLLVFRILASLGMTVDYQPE